MAKLRLKTLRDAHGMTQADVAQGAGLGSASYYAQIERNAQTTTQKTLRKLADFFGVSVADLYEDTGLPPALQRVVTTILTRYGEDDNPLTELLTVAMQLDDDKLKNLQQQAIILTQIDKVPH